MDLPDDEHTLMDNSDSEDELIGLIYETALDPGLWSLVLEGLASTIDDPAKLPVVSCQTLFEYAFTSEVHGPAAINHPPLKINNMQERFDSDCEQRLYEKVKGHLKRAIQLRLRQQRIEQKRDTLSRIIDRIPIGVLVVDADSRALFTNPTAKELIASENVLTLTGETIRLGDELVNRNFRQRVAQICSGAAQQPFSMNLEREDGGHLTLMISRFDYHHAVFMASLSAALIFITPPLPVRELPHALLYSMYGFTPSETELANGLIRGKRPGDIAAERNVSINTIRSQLGSMFAKSGTHRQSELVARLLGSAVVPKTNDTGATRPSFIPRGTRHPLAYHESKITLRDNRTMGYAEYGDPDGQPVIFCHSAYGCRYEMHPTDDSLTAHGLRLIVPDRPGVGLSDPACLNGYSDWVADLEQLTDHLAIPHFPIVGYATGGNFALTAAWYLADRITDVTVISPTLPISTFEDLRTLNPIARMSMALAQKLPRVAVQILCVLIKGAVKNPDHFLSKFIATDSLERSVITRPDIAHVFKLCLNEIVRHSIWGMPQEVRYVVQPWAFNPAEIRQPVCFWRGQRDGHAPTPLAEKLMEDIPQATVFRLPDSGHTLIYTDWKKIVKHLADTCDTIRNRSMAL